MTVQNNKLKIDFVAYFPFLPGIVMQLLLLELVKEIVKLENVHSDHLFVQSLTPTRGNIF